MIPTGLATSPPFPLGDLQVASTHSLEPLPAKLDIKVPVEDIVSVDREEEAKRIKQIAQATDGYTLFERNPPPSAACPLPTNPSSVALHPPEQDTATSPSLRLPPEILDLIVDHLFDESTTLQACGVVSRSWVPRTRKYLFACVEFNEVRSTIGSWEELFPDPSSSPAHNTRSLKIIGPSAVTAAGTEARAWIHSFHHLVELTVCTFGWKEVRASFTPFRGLAPTIKSLSFHCRSVAFLEIFGLICSFPLLEDLELRHWGRWRDIGGRDTPSTPTKPTGFPDLDGDQCPIGRELSCLPDGLRLSRIIISRPDEDTKTVMDLVSKCSDTLESLCVEYVSFGASLLASAADRYLIATHGPDEDRPGMPPPLDLSKAPKLKDMEFVVGWAGVQWIITTLQGTIPKYLRQISIYSYGTRYPPTVEGEQEWMELDRLLVELWTSYSILPKIAYCDRLDWFAPLVLPELTSRGIVPEFKANGSNRNEEDVGIVTAVTNECTYAHPSQYVLV